MPHLIQTFCSHSNGIFLFYMWLHSKELTYDSDLKPKHSIKFLHLEMKSSTIVCPCIFVEFGLALLQKYVYVHWLWKMQYIYFPLFSTCRSQVNLFFLLNIVRVLITKLKVTHQAESSVYMRAVRATLILVPLLGIQYLLLPYKPDGRLASEIFIHTTNILLHYQVKKNKKSQYIYKISIYLQNNTKVNK